MIPEFLNRYETEKNAYLKLSNKYMCELLSFDDENKIIFLRKLSDGNAAYFDDNINLTDFFDRVFNNITSDISVYKNVHVFYDELQEKYKNINDVLFCKDDIKSMLKNSIKYYDKFFKKKKLSLIHGDLRMDNILKDGDKYYAIDPIGYVAPSVFETCRFIIDDVYVNDNFSMENRLNILVNYFSHWFNKKDILISTYIFTSFITYNSTFENENDNQTKKYVELCDIIKTKINKR